MMSTVAQWLETAIQAAGNAVKAAKDERIRRNTANATTLLNWSLHLQQQSDKGLPIPDGPPPRLQHRHD
jgi:hypothetical protein